MTTELANLNRQLDALEAALPGLITDYPDPGDFWSAFAGLADVIEDAAGEHAGHVNQRIAQMLAQHGRKLAVVDDEGSSATIEPTHRKPAMTTYRLYDIQWDTDSQPVADLPAEVVVQVDDGEDAKERAIDRAGDEAGWLITDCKVEEV